MKTPIAQLKNKLLPAFIAVCLFASCSGVSDKQMPVAPKAGADSVSVKEKTEKPIIAEPKSKFDTLQEGDFMMRYPNGVIQIRGYYKNGKREGEWVAFFPSGKVQSEGYFTQGKRDHKGTVYYDNGQKMYEGMYKEGYQVGVWRFYDNTGKLKEEVDYDKKK